jgi:23S rRNA pseudouridine2605 synthase
VTNQQPHPNSSYPLRLQKFLARAGVASRRGSENLMTAGRVTVNGIVVTELGSKISPLSDVVAVDGKLISVDNSPAYLMLNKPTGLLTTMDDPQGRPTVASLVADANQPALFPVGRLDKESSGLLLFTTDGDLAYKVMHPKFELYKTYQVRVEGIPSPAALKKLAEGVWLDDGITAPAEVKYEGASLTLRIREGRNRQVRRMCKTLGHPVLELHRSHYGPLSLDKLPCGAWRYLTETEVAALKNSVECLK